MNSKLLLERKLEPFSVKKIWDDLIIDKKITGYYLKILFITLQILIFITN